jgi:hypothetical protein
MLAALFSLPSLHPQIDLGNCDIFALIASSTTTCAGGPNCPVGGGKRGVYPGTSLTGNFVGELATRPEEAACSPDRITALAAGTAIGTAQAVNMAAEMAGLTFGPGVHSFGSGLNIGLTGPIVTLDAGGDPDAVFIFYAGSTLTTCANSETVLANGAKAENVFWVIGSSLTMGADSILRGNVLAQASITIGTNGIIIGRAMAHAAVTCETHCCIALPDEFDEASCAAGMVPSQAPTIAPTVTAVAPPTPAPPTPAPPTPDPPTAAPSIAPWAQCDCSVGGDFACRDIDFADVKELTSVTD